MQDSFSYTVSDGSLSDTGTLTITIAGINDAPVANDDSASTTEDAAVTGNVLANDTDVDVEPLVVANPGTYVGSYGTLVLAADGSYTYTPNAAAQELDDGESAQDVFSYTASDGTATDTATLTITVNGLNDAPVANDDSASTTEDAGVSGNVLGNDTDVDGETLTVANPGTYVGTYGTLVLAADGSYTYTPNAAAQALDDGETVSDAFSYTATDGTASDSATLTVDVTGLNDAPVANDDAASTSEDAAVSGNVLGNDTDVDVEPLTVTNPGTYAGTYGTLTLAADGSFTYTPNAAANGLAAGESAQDVFAYTASDGTASDSASLTVTVNGANDAPTVDAGGTDASGSVTELPNNDPNENSATHTDSGTIAFDDVDVTDTHTASFTPQGGGYLGTFTLDPVDDLNDTVGWDFSVSDAVLDSLDEGEVVVQTYTVEIDDGNGGTVTQDVTVTITGTGDGPPAWYIDNSAVGSANLGTQADPYTSIAAFNAAQGTVGGPQAGHQVFLLAGTGLYAEADGINLLDGQILTGVAAGPLRPTIAPTAGDGVNLGDNNVLSGFDVTATAGAGIVDAASTSGSVTISDVNVTSTGQAAIVLDNASGVSIANVTLVSTGSYAIVATDVAGFSLTDSIASSGSATDAALSFTELTGIADFLGNTLTGGFDTLRVDTSGGSLTMTIADSGSNAAVMGLTDLNGNDSLLIETGGSASLTLTVDGVDFLGARGDMLQVVASGTSSQDLTITDNLFHNTHTNISSGGGGVTLTGTGSNIAVDYVFEGNSLRGADGHAFAATYSAASADIRGYIADNVIGINDGINGFEGSSGGGSGIFVALDRPNGAVGSAAHRVNMINNEVYDIAFGNGIHLVSNGGGAGNGSILEATLTGNTVDEMGDFAFVPLFALVGGSGGGDFSQLGLDLVGNTFDASDIDFGGHAVLLDQISADAHYYFPGYTGSGFGEFAFPTSGTASEDLDDFWTDGTHNNVFVNSAFPLFTGGVDAALISGATGDPLTEAPWFP